jgi:hypothetical protein
MPEDDISQMRSELALLRAQVQQYEASRKESEEQQRQYADFLAWIALSAEEKTQLAADRKFAGEHGDIWEVQLIEQPKIRLPAASYYDAVGRYAELCGITETAHKYSAINLSKPAESAPQPIVVPTHQEAARQPHRGRPRMQ